MGQFFKICGHGNVVCRTVTYLCIQNGIVANIAFGTFVLQGILVAQYTIVLNPLPRFDWNRDYRCAFKAT